MTISTAMGRCHRGPNGRALATIEQLAASSPHGPPRALPWSCRRGWLTHGPTRSRPSPVKSLSKGVLPSVIVAPTSPTPSSTSGRTAVSTTARARPARLRDAAVATGSMSGRPLTLTTNAIAVS